MTTATTPHTPTATTETTTPQVPYNGRLTFYHPNGNGTGSAVQFELKLGREPREKCLFLEMARQIPAERNGDPPRKGARFDWKSKLTVKLGFLDICELIAVFEGCCPKLGTNGGLYHASNGANTLIALRANTERPGYVLALSKKSNDGEQLFKGHITLSQSEAVGLRHVLQSTLFYLAFSDSLVRGECH